MHFALEFLHVVAERGAPSPDIVGRDSLVLRSVDQIRERVKPTSRAKNHGTLYDLSFLLFDSQWASSQPAALFLFRLRVVFNRAVAALSACFHDFDQHVQLSKH